MVAKELELSRATFYRKKARATREPAPPQKRGPKTELSDEALTERIRAVLNASPFLGEGYRKAWARLRMEDVRTSKTRVRRLMREAGLLAPHRAQRNLGPRVHDGTITTERPNEMWGVDATGVMTLEEGLVTVFIGVDHCTSECIGVHAAKAATRFEALEVLRQGAREQFGKYGANVAAGLTVRHDNGSQFVSRVYQEELRFLGMKSSPSFVRSPEGNGCAERFIRTLKEQLLWVKVFRNAEEVRQALQEWKREYNEGWLVERWNYLSPLEAKAALRAGKAAA